MHYPIKGELWSTMKDRSIWQLLEMDNRHNQHLENLIMIRIELNHYISELFSCLPWRILSKLA